MEDTAGAFKDLSFKVPSLNPGEELVVPRYLFDTQHLNLPSVNKSQLRQRKSDGELDGSGTEILRTVVQVQRARGRLQLRERRRMHRVCER